MRIRLMFVPPGGGENDYSMYVDLPAVPQAGDYISVQRGDKPETEDFIVKRTWWQIKVPDVAGDPVAQLVECYVECYFAVGPFSSKSHENACGSYQNKTGQLLKFDASTY